MIEKLILEPLPRNGKLDTLITKGAHFTLSRAGKIK